MIQAREKQVVEKIEDMTNAELMNFNRKFREEKKFIDPDDIEFIQQQLDIREQILRDEAGIDD